MASKVAKERQEGAGIKHEGGTHWKWHFGSIEELVGALEEYCAFQDGTVCRRYGKKDEDDSAPGADPDGKRDRVMRQNAEIDRRLIRLQLEAPTYFRLLNLFYRHALCYEHRGWELAAKRAGITTGKNRRHKRKFEVMLEHAIEELFLCR